MISGHDPEQHQSTEAPCVFTALTEVDYECEIIVSSDVLLIHSKFVIIPIQITILCILIWMVFVICESFNILLKSLWMERFIHPL